MKRAWIAVVVVVVALAGLIGWQVMKSNDEPVYKGRTLTSWLKDYWQYQPGKATVNPATVEAVQQIGTDAIPTLLRLVRASDSTFKGKVIRLLQRQHVFKVDYTPADSKNACGAYGFYALGTNGHSAVPALIQIAKDNFSSSSRAAAIDALRPSGPLAKAAVPYLLEWATNANAEVRQGARWSLLKIDPEAAAQAGGGK